MQFTSYFLQMNPVQASIYYQCSFILEMLSTFNCGLENTCQRLFLCRFDMITGNPGPLAHKLTSDFCRPHRGEMSQTLPLQQRDWETSYKPLYLRSACLFTADVRSLGRCCFNQPCKTLCTLMMIRHHTFINSHALRIRRVAYCMQIHPRVSNECALSKSEMTAQRFAHFMTSRERDLIKAFVETLKCLISVLLDWSFLCG